MRNNMLLENLRADFKRYPGLEDQIKSAAEIVKTGGYLCFNTLTHDEYGTVPCYNRASINGGYCETCKETQFGRPTKKQTTGRWETDRRYIFERLKEMAENARK